MKSTVRFGRVPKREKAKILAAMQSVNARSQEKALAVELEDENKLVSTIVTAHEETCDYTRDKIAPLIQRAREDPVYTQCTPQLACPLNPNPHPLQNGNQRVLEDFSERFSPAIRGVVEFAKRIPGFGLLSQDDQVTLLKAGVFEVLLVRLACMFDSRSNTMICLNGQVLKRESLQHTSNARFLMDSMFDFADRLNKLQLMDSELGLFCAVVVIAADRPGLRNTELVEKMQGKLMQALQVAVSQGHPQNPGLFQELMKKIPDLRTLNTLHSEKLLAFKMEPHVVAEAPHESAVPSAAAGAAASNMHALYQTQVDHHWGAYGGLSHKSPHGTPSEDSKGSWGEEPDHIVPSPTSMVARLSHSHHHHHHHQLPHLMRGGSAACPGNAETVSWSPSSSDVKDVDLYSSPRSSETGSFIIDDGVGGVKSPLGSVSSVKGGDSESVCSGEMTHLVAELQGTKRRKDPNPTSLLHGHHHPHHHHGHPQHHHHHQHVHEGGCSSGDENSVVDSPNSGKCPFKVRKLDSPTDSGIESGKELCSGGSSGSRSTSICSSPRSSMEEKVKDVSDCEASSEKMDSIEDMPVLKRALQAPPLINTNLLMDEAYKPHKKFRALRKDSDSTPTSPDAPHPPQQLHQLQQQLQQCPPLGNPSLASTHSTLVKTLEQGPRMSEQQLKHTDIIRNIIMRSEGPPGGRSVIEVTAAPLPPPTLTAYGTNVPISHHAHSNAAGVYGQPQATSPPQSQASPSSPYATAATKNVVVCPPGCYIPQSTAYATASAATPSWAAFASSAPSSVVTVVASSSSSQQQQVRTSYVPVTSVAGSNANVQSIPSVAGLTIQQHQSHIHMGPVVQQQQQQSATAMSSPPPPPQLHAQHYSLQRQSPSPAAANTSPLPRMYYNPRGLSAASPTTLATTPQSPVSAIPPHCGQAAKQVVLMTSCTGVGATSPKPTSPMAGQVVVVEQQQQQQHAGDNQPLNLSKKLPSLQPISLHPMDRAALVHMQRIKMEAV